MSEHEEQAMPTPNDGPAIQDMVIDDIRRRKILGIQRYGTPLQAFNGRDALRDAYEELLDGACYLRQLIAERDAVPVTAQATTFRDASDDVWKLGANGKFFTVGVTPDDFNDPHCSYGRTRDEIVLNYGPIRPVR